MPASMHFCKQETKGRTAVQAQQWRYSVILRRLAKLLHLQTGRQLGFVRCCECCELGRPSLQRERQSSSKSAKMGAILMPLGMEIGSGFEDMQLWLPDRPAGSQQP